VGQAVVQVIRLIVTHTLAAGLGAIAYAWLHAVFVLRDERAEMATWEDNTRTRQADMVEVVEAGEAVRVVDQ